MIDLNFSQLNLIANFLSNMAVVWFAAAFIAPANIILSAISFVEGVVALGIAIWIMNKKEV